MHAALEKAEDYIKQVRATCPPPGTFCAEEARRTKCAVTRCCRWQLEKEKKELQAQAEKLRYRIGILTTNVRESDAHLKAALTADSQERARLVEELAHLCL